MKRLVLFVEGEGEAEAAPLLVSKLMSAAGAYEVMFLDPATMRVGQVNKLLKHNCREWQRKLGVARKRPNLGGVLLLLDGDVRLAGKQGFCPATVAQKLAVQAQSVGGGSQFSVATVFAKPEYETWLIASIESMVEQRLSDGRRIAPAGTQPPEGDLELAPRDAKGWLHRTLEGGYKPTRDQAELTRLADLELVCQRQLRSFRRLESALQELTTAFRTNQHMVSPVARS